MSISARDKIEQLTRQAEAGEYLHKKRDKKGVSLANVAENVGCSPSYLSEIERGLKLPGDVLISRIARYYDIDEPDLFRRYGKVPLSAIEEVENNPVLQKTLLEISRNKDLTEEKKQDYYDKIHKIYLRMFEKSKIQEEDNCDDCD